MLEYLPPVVLPHVCSVPPLRLSVITPALWRFGGGVSGVEGGPGSGGGDDDAEPVGGALPPLKPRSAEQSLRF
ncbi:hypothetical protein GJAV_G00119100 [Gymnothorax javanicus]|nr:hypothetical protein GJAV_G00119100 [Gymnothorax javanicus]